MTPCLSTLFITNTLQKLFSKVFLVLFFSSSKRIGHMVFAYVYPSMYTLILPKYCDYSSVLKLRSLSCWFIFFEPQVVKGGNNSALPCAATLSSLPTKKVGEVKKRLKPLCSIFVQRSDRDLVILAFPNQSRIARSHSHHRNLERICR